MGLSPKCRETKRATIRQVSACFVITMICATSFVFADDSEIGPKKGSKDSPTIAPMFRGDLPSVESVWRNPPVLRSGPRGGVTEVLLYDNGMPLDDKGFDDTIQFSLAADGASGVWQYYAAIADDFAIEDPFLPLNNIRITNVRMATFFFNTGGGDPNPNPVGTWSEGVYVIVYDNSPLDIPDGQPLTDPTNPIGTVSFLGNPVAVQIIPPEQLTEMAVDGSCNSRYIVDIPVDITVQKNTRYWLSVIPRYPAPPQCAWNNSELNTGFVAHFGSPTLGFDFWSASSGNAGNIDCPSAPPPQTRRDLSFQLYGEEIAPTEVACCDLFNEACTDENTVEDCFAINPFTIAFVNATCADVTCPEILGACCDDLTGTCTDNVNLFDCFANGGRFDANATCLTLDPPCGTTETGACCQDGGVCSDVSPTDCSLLDGLWLMGDCMTAQCPPPNDICVNATIITDDVIIPFSNINANTDGPLDSPGGICTNVNQDVWFRYVAPCTGTATIATCVQTDFDSALAVYDGCFCDSNQGPLIACNNNNCGPTNDDARVTLPVVEGNCYLIRVGGAGMAEGHGFLIVGCVPAELGACCNPAGACQVLNEIDCMAFGGDFFEGEPCSPITCPAPSNDDCASAVEISEGYTNFDTTNATTGADEQPNTPCVEINNDIWFRHTATCDGELLISLCGATNYDSAIAVYDDDCMNGPDCPVMEQSLACDDDGCGMTGGPSEVTLSVTTGQCVLIRVGGVGTSVGTGTIFIGCVEPGQGACCDALDGCETRAEVDCMDTGDVYFDGRPCELVSCEAPVNDDCPNATEISNGVFDFSTLRATTDGPMVDPMGMNCLPVDRDVWFSYMASCDGMLLLTPCLDTDYDATIAVYDGCVCPNDTTGQIACTSGDIDAGCDLGDNQNRVSVPVTSGQCYLIRVGGDGNTVGSGRLIVGCLGMDEGACCLGAGNCVIDTEMNCVMAGGDFTLGDVCSPLTCPPIANDNCDNAIEISEGIPVPFDTTDATTDGPMDSPGGLCVDVTKDIWYSITATCNGQMLVSLCANTTYDAALSVYAGLDCPPMAAPVACDNDGCMPDGAAELAIAVQVGEQYLIRVGGNADAVGAGELLVTCAPSDACCPGDPTGDQMIALDDIAPLVALILNPPLPDDPAFCRADVNQDMMLNGLDLNAMTIALITGAECGEIPVDLLGACCATSGGCTIRTQLECFNIGDTYLGNGTGCMPNLCDQPPPPPANDFCANAIELSCNDVVLVNNTAATTTPDEPAFSCRFNGPGQGVGTVWYTFVAESEDALISTCGTLGMTNDTLVAVYEGTCPSDSSDEIACVEDAGGACGRLAQVCVDGLSIGQTYTVQIASYDNASRGNILVELACPCPRGACCFLDGSCEELRENECFVSGGAYQGDGVTCATDPCPPPPQIECCVGDLSQDGVVDLLDIAPFVAGVLAPESLNVLNACIADVNGDAAVNGDDIAAFVPLVLAEEMCPVLTNDDCANAMELSCGVRVIVNNFAATTAVDDPIFTCHAGGPAQGVGTLWYKFTATATSARVRTCGSIPPATDTILAVYDAACPPTTGDQLGCSEDVGLPCGERLSEVCVGGLTPGNEYLIQVASFDEASRGFISVQVECPCP